MHFATEDGIDDPATIDLDEGAKAGVAYIADSGTLSWGDGETGTKPISIGILVATGTGVGWGSETGEYFKVNLDSPTGGAILGNNKNSFRVE